jgi:arylsulfatase A-like enzyme
MDKFMRLQPSSLNRRDFLKLLALLPALAATRIATRALSFSQTDVPGVIVIVLDALSAANMSLYGYPRQTTPNIDRFASRSNVYHAHYSTANFTSPGTASLLTGTHPWTHRAFHYEGVMAADRVDSNIFRYWGDSAVRLGYTQNPWVDLLLYQFSPWLDRHLDLQEFSLVQKPFYDILFRNDPIAAYKSAEDLLRKTGSMSAAPLSSLVEDIRNHLIERRKNAQFASKYPLGIPRTINDAGTYFLLEDVFDGLMQLTDQLPPASLSYIHLFPPHGPYAPQKKFLDLFIDGWQPAIKPPAHFLKSVSQEMEAESRKLRWMYDSYVATVDFEFGRLLDFMETQGILERNFVILTSDHGDNYERGVDGHTNEYLYEPLIRIPLLISSPGQASRVDLHAPTSSVDLMPTLLSLTKRPVPDTGEGTLLPGLGGEAEAQRSIFAIDTKASSVRGPIRNATISLRKGRYKLIAYLGYKGFEDGYELYDLQNDPEEMNDLFRSKPETVSELRHEVAEKLRQVNAPYL